MRHLFLINPTAGKADRSAEIAAEAQALFNQSGDTCEIRISSAQGDITRFAREAGADGVETRIYACGGDGTLNEAATGAQGYPNLSLTCYPTGSGNDFIRYFTNREAFYTLQNFQNVREFTSDLMRVNDRICVNICSAGFDARIGTAIDAYRRIPLLGGSRAYAASIVVNLLRGVVKPCRVELDDGQVFDENMTLCCICNGRWYGGGYNPIPEADMTDGILDVLVVKKVSRLTVAKVIAAYQKGQYADFPEIITRCSAKRVHITTPAPEPVNLDGELLTTADFTVEVLPQTIRLFTPEAAWHPAP